MESDQIHDDIVALSGHLDHRDACSDNEERAAGYIRNRFREYTPDCTLDPFGAPESNQLLFACYYGEFLVVCLLALWWPTVAFVYGLVVFLAYLAEANGCNVLARFWPHFESQNVIGRFVAADPRRVVVVSANYDSGRQTPLSHLSIVPYLRILHVGAAAAMASIVASCAVPVFSNPVPEAMAGALAVRYAALVYLAALAAAVVVSEMRAESTPGANGNASGVAAILALGARLHRTWPATCDVWLLATGAGEAGHKGMDHFMASHDIDKENTFFLTIDHVGAGDLRYVEAEGLVNQLRCAAKLIGMAQTMADTVPITPLRVTGRTSDLFIPLSRGFNALRLTATGPDGIPVRWRSVSDTADLVEPALIRKAVDVAEEIVRALDAEQVAE